MTRFLWRVSRHGILFAIAKSSVLVAPLLAAKLLSKDGYGQVEWWLALSMAVGPVIALGSHGLLAYASVGSKARLHERTAGIYVIQIGMALLSLGAIALLLGVDPRRYFLVPVMIQSGLVCLQMSLSARLKGMGFGALASPIESGVYVCMFLALMLSTTGLNFFNSYMWLLVMAGCANAIGISKVIRIPKLGRWWRRNYRGFIRHGSRFMFGGLVLGFFMAGPRGLLGVLDGEVAVARFALAFRWLAVAMVVHQFFTTVFFRAIYAGSSSRDRDTLLATIAGLVAVLGGVIATALLNGWLDGTGVPLPSREDSRLIWFLATAMIFWATTSGLEGALYRVEGAMDQLFAAVSGLAGFAIGVLILSTLNLDVVLTIALSWLLGFVVTISLQFRALAARRQVFPKLLIVAWLGAALTLGIASFS